MPFVSRKNGKMLNLLKASAKKINPNKRRKVIPILGNIKNFHESVKELEKNSKQKPSQDTRNITFDGHQQNDQEQFHDAGNGEDKMSDGEFKI